MRLLQGLFVGLLLLMSGAYGQNGVGPIFGENPPGETPEEISADPSQYGAPFDAVPDIRDINMYQVNIRAYSEAGDLDGVTERLDEIADLGTNVIYLMPIFPVGEDERSMVADVTSPYSIKDFGSVGSEFGDLEDLRELVDGAHERGMAVILDFVVNQTSWDHPWITEHPEWYLQENGEIQPLIPFTDVAALDLDNEEVRAEIIKALRYWVFEANVDGFRFDYANNASLEFWEQVNGDLRSIDTHDLILLAEGDRVENFDVGFDMNFGFKWYYEALRAISEGESADALAEINTTEYGGADETQRVVRYIGNHDTNGDGTAAEVFGGQRGAMANFVISAYMKGVPFIYGGQEVAFEERITFPWASVNIDWDQNEDVTAEFKRILDFRIASEAIRRGELSDLSNDDIAAFIKESANEKVAVFANLRFSRDEFTIPAEMAGEYNDAYTGEVVTLVEGEGLPLEGFEYRAVTTAEVDAAPPGPTPPSVVVLPIAVTLGEGETQPFEATVKPAGEEASWDSSNPAVATVDATGLVTAVGAGAATITASTADATGEANIDVYLPGEFTVRFYRPDDWASDINIYYWDALPAGLIPQVSWPGVAMTDDGDGWYSYVFENITTTNVIFNDGANQTGNLSRTEDGWYYNDEWFDEEPDVE